MLRLSTIPFAKSARLVSSQTATGSWEHAGQFTNRGPMGKLKNCWKETFSEFYRLVVGNLPCKL